MHEWCDTTDSANLAKFDISVLRAAHYIEWFSKRDFYDGRQLPLINSENGILKTGLYFEGDRPIVIYPRLRDGVDD